MKNTRFLVAGIGVGLCLGALAKADDDEARTEVRPVVVKRLIVFTGHRDQVIYVRRAYPVQSVVPVNRPYVTTAQKIHRHSSESPATISRDSSSSVAKVSKTSSDEVNRPDQKADKDNKPADIDRKAETNASESDDALDQLTAQAQKEEELRLGEPDSIGHR